MCEANIDKWDEPFQQYIKDSGLGTRGLVSLLFSLSTPKRIH